MTPQWVARPEKTVRMYFAPLSAQNIEEILKQYLLTSSLPSLYHSASQYVARFSLRQDPLYGGGMQTAFAAWIGQPVVLQVAVGDIKVPLRGRLLKEAEDTLRVRIGNMWDVDIYKTMVLAVEEDSMATVAA
jgi:hypothetical protein